MSSSAAASDAALGRDCVLVVDGSEPHDIFELVSATDDLVRVRSPYLFEVGEELTVRVELAGRVSEAVAVVRAHVGPVDARITELQLLPAVRESVP